MGTAGDPSGRYCANLGHKQDDESGLIYMRARYYEPTSWRFISEDPERQEGNYFSYCRSNPVDGADVSGNETITQAFYIGLVATFMKLVSQSITEMCFGKRFTPGQIMDIAFRWLVEGGALAGLIKGFETKGVEITAKALGRKLIFGAVGGALGGMAIGTIAALHLGEHCGEIMNELFDQYMETCTSDSYGC